MQLSWVLKVCENWKLCFNDICWQKVYFGNRKGDIFLIFVKMETPQNDEKMEGWLYLIRFNRFGLEYSRKRYFILEENCLKSFKSIPTSDTQVHCQSPFLFFSYIWSLPILYMKFCSCLLEYGFCYPNAFFLGLWFSFW